MQLTHRAHLAVGAFYTRSMSLPAALVKMRHHIQQYNLLNNNPAGYSETITRLFLARMTTDLRAGVACRSLPDEIDRLAQHCNLGWLYENYSKELIHSPLAKREWVSPDLQQIDFLSGINWVDELPIAARHVDTSGSG